MSTKQAVFWVDATKRVAVPSERRPGRVWTLYLHTDKDVAPALPIQPIHHHGAFLEDYIHDWHWSASTKVLRYFSRAIDCNTWILCEWEAA